TFTTRMGFTSRETSVGGLMQYRSRYYSPDTGRFFQQDSYQGQDGAPPSLHRYVYCLNSPINYVDPAGRSAVLDDFLVDFLTVELWACVLNLFALVVVDSVGGGDFAAAFWMTMGAVGGLMFWI